MADPQPQQRDAFLKAYDDYGNAIFRHCAFRVYNRERGKELMQETFMRAWEYISRGEKIENIRAFLYRIANNLIIDDSRKKKETSLENLQEQGFDPQDESQLGKATRQVEAHMVMDTLRKLDPTYRDVLLLRFVDGLKPAEIASILGLSPNVVSVRIHRGTRQLISLVRKDE